MSSYACLPVDRTRHTLADDCCLPLSLFICALPFLLVSPHTDSRRRPQGPVYLNSFVVGMKETWIIFVRPLGHFSPKKPLNWMRDDNWHQGLMNVINKYVWWTSYRQQLDNDHPSPSSACLLSSSKSSSPNLCLYPLPFTTTACLCLPPSTDQVYPKQTKESASYLRS